MGRKRNVNQYVQDVELTRHVLLFVEKCKDAEACGLPRPRINDYIGGAILNMAVGMSKRGNFVSYTFREELVGVAVEDVIRYLKNYDWQKSQWGKERGAFSYINRIIWQSFLRVIKREKKRFEFEQSLIMSAGIIDDVAVVQGHDDRAYGNQYLDRIKSDADDYYRMGGNYAAEQEETADEKPKKERQVSDLEEFFE